MIVTSKNGLRLDIKPKRWWNLFDWMQVFEQAELIKKQNIFMDKCDWTFSYGTIKEVREDDKTK